MTDPVFVFCMKWGDMYGPEYVNNLAAGVKRHLRRPYRIICFTDQSEGIQPDVEVLPIPELELPSGKADRRWRKLGLFRRDLYGLSGTALFLDLDLVILDELNCFFDAEGDFLIVRDDELFRSKPLRRLNPRRDKFLRSVGNSSVFRFEIGAHSYIYEELVADMEGALSQYEISQQFQSAQVAKFSRLAYWPKGWCVSFKNSCVPRGLRSYFSAPSPPVGARIVVFAGRPKMQEVLDGGGGRWYRKIGDVDWLRRAWLES
ncbi:MAG: hypothetical protein ACK4ZU_10460 [Allorhizobium sp.]